MLNNELGFWGIPQLIDSLIISDQGSLEFMLDYLPEYSSVSLLFRGSRDGIFTNDLFHNKCVGKGKTITLIKSSNGNIFGGYASEPWP